MPLWGQDGEFIVTAHGIRVRITIEGLFGLGSGLGYWPGFEARAVDRGPFLSDTGYRTFLGAHAEPRAGLTPDAFAWAMIGDFVTRTLNGRPVALRSR